MALPVILVNSATGSDTAASGAGPATAITGSAGISAVDGLSVLLDGSPDISGVAVDGSAVIYFADATAGNQNFAKITAIANSGGPTATVTVATAYGLSLTKAWAIGGVRASIGNTTSIKLFSNNSAAGDAKPGWAEEMQSGHTETLAANFLARRAGDTTDGHIELRGTSGAVTPPVLTFSNNGIGFSSAVNFVKFQNFDLKNTNATKTASVGIALTGNQCVVRGVRIVDATDKFWKGITFGGGCTTIENVRVANTAAQGIQGTTGPFSMQLRNIHVKAAGATAGIDITTTSTAVAALLEDILVTGCTGQGILLALTGTNFAFGFRVMRCTIDACTVDGVRISGSSSQMTGYFAGLIENCNITANGGWGVNFSNASAPSLAQLRAAGFNLRNCNFGTGATANTGGDVSVASLVDSCINVDPGYVATGSDNYGVGASVAALGYPGVVGQSGTTSYMDIGAAQRIGAATPASAGA